jgi:hypothetical protein
MCFAGCNFRKKTRLTGETMKQMGEMQGLACKVEIQVRGREEN